MNILAKPDQAAEDEVGVARLKLPLFDEQRGLVGPITRRAQRRSLLIWTAAMSLGLLLCHFGSGTFWSGFGLGLFFPGAGFLYSANPILFVLTPILFIVSLLMWLLIGAFVAPLLVWLGAAVLAGILAKSGQWDFAEYVVPLLTLGLIGLGLLGRGKRLEQQLAVVRKLNSHLEGVDAPAPSSRYEVAEPLTDADLGALRFTLDLALQPLDRFDGFTTIDQFREAAWRYQLYAIANALSVLRTTRLPAFDGYVDLAQRNAITKMTDLRVWKYWFWENVWGNGRVNPDPMVRENIMISGWFGLTLGAHQASSGDKRFDAPGSLPFRWSSRKTYFYDYPKIVNTLMRNFNKDAMCLFPCEPNWVFAYCNEQGMAGLKLFDQMHGTDHATSLMPLFRQRLEEEFTRADGGQNLIYANRVGFALGGGGLKILAGNLWMRNMFAPDLAARGWEQVRHEFFKYGEQEVVPMGKGDGLDAGNYSKSEDGRAFYPLLMVVAQEMGDTEVYEFARRRHDALPVENVNGAWRYPGSTTANLTAAMARFASPGAWYRMANIALPQTWREGPRLAQVPYPQVLVAMAVSDGQMLDLELVPGSEPGRFPLRFSGLKPGLTYRCDVDDQLLVATTDGAGEIQLDLKQRQRIRLIPVQ
ncbi:hypothetical protein [Pseudomonas umsongensis]|uniref:linalool dehydratase/isomerase domain-containing protein n=1 Tax=Pseudomonas umsongensis TaxID=198618 RepID=UPI002009EE28|nr:hypothetical protein [Pseudomonas umsongensis]MCK8682682.1 hypothetical protein [Pseudomonas umsongensis]